MRSTGVLPSMARGFGELPQHVVGRLEGAVHIVHRVGQLSQRRGELRLIFFVAQNLSMTANDFAASSRMLLTSLWASSSRMSGRAWRPRLVARWLRSSASPVFSILSIGSVSAASSRSDRPRSCPTAPRRGRSARAGRLLRVGNEDDGRVAQQVARDAAIFILVDRLVGLDRQT